MFNYAPKLWTTVPQDFIERKTSLSRASQQTLFSSVFGSTVRVFILASAVCTGGWLGIRPYGLVERPGPAVFRSDAVPTRASRCGGNNSAAADDIPPGYTLVDIRRVGEDCFALLRSRSTNASRTAGASGGMADVFGRDGRLMLRFFAIGQPNGDWELFEYRRLPQYR
ncbi:MAG: hypothetical protein ACLQU2_21065 [Candidatus Binataceae bacterium]